MAALCVTFLSHFWVWLKFIFMIFTGKINVTWLMASHFFASIINNIVNWAHESSLLINNASIDFGGEWGFCKVSENDLIPRKRKLINYLKIFCLNFLFEMLLEGNFFSLLRVGGHSFEENFSNELFTLFCRNFTIFSAFFHSGYQN